MTLSALPNIPTHNRWINSSEFLHPHLRNTKPKQKPLSFSLLLNTISSKSPPLLSHNSSSLEREILETPVKIHLSIPINNLMAISSSELFSINNSKNLSWSHLNTKSINFPLLINSSVNFYHSSSFLDQLSTCFWHSSSSSSFATLQIFLASMGKRKFLSFFDS